MVQSGIEGPCTCCHTLIKQFIEMKPLKISDGLEVLMHPAQEAIDSFAFIVDLVNRHVRSRGAKHCAVKPLFIWHSSVGKTL